MRLKVLPLDEWMKRDWMREQCNVEVIKYPTLWWPELIDAKYCMFDTAWFVVDSVFYKYDVGSFRYDLAIANTKIYRECEYKALCLLRTAGLLNKEMKHDLYMYEFWIDLRNTNRRAIKNACSEIGKNDVRVRNNRSHTQIEISNF